MIRPALVFLLLGGLYLFGAIGGIGWGDGALFQRKAVRLELSAGGLAHPHYVLAAHPFTRIPGLPPALGVTLFSTFATLGALALLYATLRALLVGELAALAAAVATGSAHLVWFHAVVPEVYPLATLLHAGVVYAVVAHHYDDRPGWLPLAGGLLGFAFGVHLLAVVPGFFLAGYLLLRRPPAAVLWAVGGAALAGASPYLALLFQERDLFAAGGGSFLQSWRFGHAPAGCLILAGAWLYSFPPLAGFFGAAGLARLAAGRKVLGPLVVATTLFQVALVAPYRVKDAPVFLLPAFWMFGLGVGYGLDRFLAARATRRRAGADAFLVLAFFLVPAVLYAVAPEAARRLLRERETPIRLAGKPLFRVLPGRDDVRYALFPPKRGMSARPYAEAVAREVGPGSLVIADWTLLTPLLYLQAVEGRLADVRLEEVSRDAQAARARAALAEGRSVYLASHEPDYYDVAGISALGRLAPAGPIYRVAP